jgi:hypothetical protein
MSARSVCRTGVLAVTETVSATPDSSSRASSRSTELLTTRASFRLTGLKLGASMVTL